MFRKMVAVVATLVASLALIAGPSATAHADTCGDTLEQWVPSTGSTWSGTVGEDTMATSFISLLGVEVAVSVVENVPGTGGWAYQYNGINWNSEIAGIGWSMSVNATDCADGKVISASGGTTDPIHGGLEVYLDRTE